MKRGTFITFEGPEGSGKSTQAARLCGFLRKRGYSVLYLREPGGTEISEAIRKILLAPRHKRMSVETEALLYLASRAQIVKEKIAPALKKGKVVILDRFQDSTLAYQGYGEGIDLGLLKKLGQFATRGIKPDLTFLLDVESKAGLDRALSKDRIEIKPLAFHRRVRRGYLELAQKNAHRIFLIKANKDMEAIMKIIQAKALELLKRGYSQIRTRDKNIFRGLSEDARNNRAGKGN
jgi:dTMP kinase